MEFKEEILLQDTFGDDDSDEPGDEAGEVVPPKKTDDEEVDEFGIDEEEAEE